MDLLIEKANQGGIPVIVDPKPPHFEYYRRVDGITPNLGEAEGMVNRAIYDDESAAQAARLIRRKYGVRFTLITRGDRGITASERGRKTFHMPVAGHEVFDVTGAGDTVVSVLTLALISGASLREAVAMANAAASIVIEKIGTSQTSLSELRHRIQLLGRQKIS
jgi:D-beta-D-heptose 7-phosphate kinase/D-beta-D-heptose 1-phosphate adenosyltransferase